MAAEKAWVFESSSSDAVYKTILHEDGHLSCDCRGWTFKRGEKPRECKHTKIVAQKTGAPSAYDETRGPMSYSPTRPAKPNAVLPGAGTDRKPTTVRPIQVKAENEIALRFANIEFGEMDEGQAYGRVFQSKLARLDSDYVAPMLASSMPEGKSIDDFEGSYEWVMEEKYDGHRVTVIVSGGIVSAWSRPQAGKDGKPNGRALPDHIAKAASLLRDGTYDGELIVRRGGTNRAGRSYDVTDGANAALLQYVVFDMPRSVGRDLTSRSYEERMEEMTFAFAGGGAFQPGAIARATRNVPSRKALEAIWARDGEGAILKRTAGIYRPGARSKDFIKIKKLRTAVLTIIGFQPGKSGPFSTVTLRGGGNSETSVRVLNNEEMRRIVAVKGQTYIGRKLRIEYQERTPDGSYRHPRWDRLEDE